MTLPLSAQTRFGIGAAIGAQSFHGSGRGFQKPLPSVELLARGARIGAGVTAEAADLDGHMIAYHSDLLFGVTPTFWLGAGASHVSVDGFESTTTWNAEAELVHKLTRMELDLRARYYPMHLQGFREDVETTSPAVYGGVRFWF